MKKLITYRYPNAEVQRMTSVLNEFPIWLLFCLASFSCPFLCNCCVSKLLLFEGRPFKKGSVFPHLGQNRKAWIRPKLQKGTLFNPFCQA